MRLLDDFKTQNKCGDCGLRASSYFCNFSERSLRHFQSIKITNSYPKGARLFIEGQPTDGVFMLCRGRVKLTTHSRHGKSLILRIAVPGEVLGLSAVISGTVSESTAEVIEPCQVNFVLKSEFRRFLEENADAGMNALHQLSLQYKTAHMQIRSLGLSACVADKLATLLLEWSKNEPSNNGSVHLRNTFSHEEIGEMIGTSRETVTRILKDFRVRDLISIKGPNLHIPNMRNLEATIGS
ncbi:MAG: Crp/Fnr family transcriptional regulator [bacterium]|nr:Crp/Fnr family transcriptional regulator [bacterium]